MQRYFKRKYNDYYPNMYNVIKALEPKTLNYKWLITDIETINDDYFANKEYVIIKHKDLIKKLSKNNNMQWIWGVFSAIPAEYDDNTILKYELPYIIENKKTKPIIQHPLAKIEIDCIDSSYLEIIAKGKDTVDLFAKGATSFPLKQAINKKSTSKKIALHDELKAELVGYQKQFIVRAKYIFENNKAIACYMENESDNDLFLENNLDVPYYKYRKREGNIVKYEWSDEYFEVKGKGKSKEEITAFLKEQGFKIKK